MTQKEERELRQYAKSFETYDLALKDERTLATAVLQLLDRVDYYRTLWNRCRNTKSAEWRKQGGPA